jgi:hypothetical protein
LPDAVTGLRPFPHIFEKMGELLLYFCFISHGGGVSPKANGVANLLTLSSGGDWYKKNYIHNQKQVLWHK